MHRPHETSTNLTDLVIGLLCGCVLLTGCQTSMLHLGRKGLPEVKAGPAFHAPRQEQQIAYEAQLRQREAQAKAACPQSCPCCK